MNTQSWVEQTGVSNSAGVRATMKETGGPEGWGSPALSSARGTPTLSPARPTRGAAGSSLRSLFMIPMSCPSCGRRGNVPLDRLNTRMHCKKCDAVFHLDATGKPVLGEPKVAKGGKSSAKGRSKDEPLDPIGMLAAKLAKVPKAIYLGLLGILAAYALYALYPRTAPPDRLTALAIKAEDLAKAFLNKDPDAIKAMATDNTKDEAGRLIEEYRGILGDSTVPVDQIMVTVGPPVDAETDQPRVTIDFQPPRPEGAKTTPPPAHLDTAWYEAKNTWYLNGKGTLEDNKARAERENPKGASKKK